MGGEVKLEKNESNPQPDIFSFLYGPKISGCFNYLEQVKRQIISVVVIFQKGSMIVKMRDKLEPTCFARLEKKAHKQTKIRNRNLHYIFQNLLTFTLLLGIVSEWSRCALTLAS